MAFFFCSPLWRIWILLIFHTRCWACDSTVISIGSNHCFVSIKFLCLTLKYILYYSIRTNKCMSGEALIVKTLKIWLCKTVILLLHLLIWTNCELQIDDLRHLWLFGDSVDPAAGWCDTWMSSVLPATATQMTSTQWHHSQVGWTLLFISRFKIKCVWNIRPEEKCCE